MANALYDLAKEEMISGSLDFTEAGSQDYTCVLVSSTYTFSAAHEDYVELSGVIAEADANLSSKTVTGGVFDAGNATFTAVASGSTIDAVIIFLNTGTAADDRLIAYIDTDSGGPISQATNDGDITVTWDASGIFAL